MIRRDWLVSPRFIFVLAFLIRMAICVTLHTYRFPQLDGKYAAEYGNVAASIVRGAGFSSPYGHDTGPTALMAPIYAYLLAAVFRVFGTYSATAAILILSLQSLCSALICWAIYSLVAKTLDKAAAPIAAWVWAVSPLAIHASVGYVWETSFSTLLTIVAVLLTLRLNDSSRMAWTAYGALWGIIALTNTALAFLFPFYLVWALFKHGQPFSRTMIAKASLAVAAAVVIVTPWIARNTIVFGRPTFIRDGMPLELYGGAMMDTAEARQSQNGIIETPAEQRAFLTLGERSYMDDRGQKARRIISADPLHFARLSAQRVEQFWLGGLGRFQGRGRLTAIAGLTLFAAIACAGWAGLLLCFLRRNVFALFYSIPLLIYPDIYYITHCESRFRHPIEPYLIALGAYGVVMAFRAIAARFKPLEIGDHVMPQPLAKTK